MERRGVKKRCGEIRVERINERRGAKGERRKGRKQSERAGGRPSG